MKLKIELQVHSTFKDRMETIEKGANGERKNHLLIIGKNLQHLVLIIFGKES